VPESFGAGIGRGPVPTTEGNARDGLAIRVVDRDPPVLRVENFANYARDVVVEIAFDHIGATDGPRDWSCLRTIHVAPRSVLQIGPTFAATPAADGIMRIRATDSSGRAGHARRSAPQRPGCDEPRRED